MVFTEENKFFSHYLCSDLWSPWSANELFDTQSDSLLPPITADRTDVNWCRRGRLVFPNSYLLLPINKATEDVPSLQINLWLSLETTG